MAGPVPIRALTFDFWDTLVVDDSDEPERIRQGLLPKAQARTQLFVDEICRHHPHLEADQAAEAHDKANAWFRHCWKIEQHTPSVAQRLSHALGVLAIPATPGFDDMVRAYEEMEVRIPPRLAPGIQNCLETLATRWPLGIISDAIVTPGRGLRQILQDHNLLSFFTVFVFSDEAGAAKPAPRVFDLACDGFGISPEGLVHIGDRESNDVAGPQAFGARGVLYTGAIDRGSSESRADAICTDHTEMPAILDLLSTGAVS